MYLKVLKNFTDLGLWEGMFQGSLRSSATLLQAANGGCDATGRKTWSRCFLSYSTCCWFITGTYRNYFSKKCLHQSVSGCSRGLNCIFCSISVSRYVSSCCQHSSLYTRTSQHGTISTRLHTCLGCALRRCIFNRWTINKKTNLKVYAQPKRHVSLILELLWFSLITYKSSIRFPFMIHDARYFRPLHVQIAYCT